MPNILVPLVLLLFVSMCVFSVLCQLCGPEGDDGNIIVYGKRIMKLCKRCCNIKQEEVEKDDDDDDGADGRSRRRMKKKQEEERGDRYQLALNGEQHQLSPSAAVEINLPDNVALR